MKFPGIKVTGYDNVGNSFVAGMAELDRLYSINKQKFTKFLNSLGIDAWHYHNGWVCSKTGHKRTGSHVTKQDDIIITWWDGNNEHSPTPPKNQDTIAIGDISVSPSETDVVFDLHVYKLLEDPKKWYFGDQYNGNRNYNKTTKLGTIQVYLDSNIQNYKLFVPKKKKIGRIKKLLGYKHTPYNVPIKISGIATEFPATNKLKSELKIITVT